MKDDSSDRIHELQKQISHWSSEFEHSLEQRRQSQQTLQKTLTSTGRAALIASIPGAVWILIWCRSKPLRGAASSWDQFVSCVVCLTLFGLISAGAARASSLFSHWWFREMRIREGQAATIMTVCAEIVIFGWVLVIFRWR